MITELHLHQIGPVMDLKAEFGPRLNLITGDNGLGKTFLLDACWYALTRTWADGRQFYPSPEVPKSDAPFIEYSLVGKGSKPSESHAEYQFATQIWKRPQARTAVPGLVLYARIDGGFSVWDPARNYWREDAAGGDRPAAYQFSKAAVWDGLEEGHGDQKKVVCNGLLRDVENWRARSNGSFDLLQRVLEELSGGDTEVLKLGEGVRVRLDDVRDIPTLRLPYGVVPVTQAAAGMRRVLALSYLLVWAWTEHRRASQLQKEPPTARMVLLFDEVEAHLHPKWQRVFLPSLLEVVKGLLRDEQVEGAVASVLEPAQSADSLIRQLPPQSVQVIATTHAPLVLASLETVWDNQQDRLFDFNLVERRVTFEPVEFARHGSAANWLTSGSFDLSSSDAITAEKAMGRADEFMLRYPQGECASRAEAEEVHNALRQAMGGDDEYWAYWLPYYKRIRRTT